LSAAAPEQVLEFWFGRLTEGFADPAHRERWFRADDAFDQAIRAPFAGLLEQAEAGALDRWLESARGTLAFILVTDQFPRNLHRGSARAFAWDPVARSAAAAGIRRSFDTTLDFDERAFFYLPFEHSEDLLDQHTSVGLFSALRDETPPGKRHLTGEYLRHAHEHRNVILRFGRFPYRNTALGRTSSPEEQAYLDRRRA
jgi:uncharacterized protein (DUF924 family)